MTFSYIDFDGELYEMAPGDYPAALMVAREWIALCAAEGCWADLEEADVPGLDDAAVIRGVDQHWGGGLRAFLTGCADEITERRATLDAVALRTIRTH